MKHDHFRRLIALVLTLCLLAGMIPVTVQIEAQAAIGGLSSLTCADFISNSTAQTYIDTMMRYYINSNTDLKDSLTSGDDIIFMFEGGSDNYWDGSDYTESAYDTRDQAVVIVVKLDSSDNAYIHYYCENCSSIPGDPTWCTSGVANSGSTTIYDGVYPFYRWDHTGPYAAFQLDVDGSTAGGYGYYTPTSNPDGEKMACNGINIHTRASAISAGSDLGWAWSEGCQVIGSGDTSTNEYNAFFQAVMGVTWSPWVSYYSSPKELYAYSDYGYSYGTGYTEGYYVVDRQLGLMDASGTEYGSGSLIALYNETALTNITAYSTAARANADFDYASTSCTFYPSYCQFTTTKSTPINSQPCSAGNNGSETLETAASGATYTAIGMYQNTGSNFWYQVKTSSGDIGYIYSGHTTYVQELTSDITLTDYSTPSAHVSGDIFYVTGTIKSTYNQLDTAAVYVHNGFGTSGTKVTGSSDTVSNNSYTLLNSNIDYNTAFNEVGTGNYTYAISVTYTNYYAAAAKTLGTNSGTKYLCEDYFVVIDSSVDQSSCSHSYTTTTVTAATCTATGTQLKSCSTCGLISESAVAATGHSYGSWTVTDATCGAEGTKTRTCSVCGDVQTETIAATDHDYDLVIHEATCAEYEIYEYICANCGDSYSYNAGTLASQWIEEIPEGMDASLFESKTQYRYSDYETTTSYDTSMDGWTQLSSEWVQSSTKTVNYVASWPSGFDTSNSLYTTYNNASSKVTASTGTTTKTVIDSDAVVGYLWYHWCTGSTIYSAESKTGSYVNFHAFYSTTMTPSNYNDYDSSDGSYKFTSSTACSNCVWYWYATVYAQKSTTYNKLFTYERWTDWSDWSDTAATASSTRQVEEREVYRLISAELAGHSYSSVVTEPTCTKDGSATYTCSVCGDTYTEILASEGHDYNAVTHPATCTEYAQIEYTCGSCGDNYKVYADSWTEWSTTVPDDMENKLVETVTQYRYSDYETTTSYDTSMDGWTQLSSEWVQSGTKTVTYVASWPSGFDTTNSLYTTYNKASSKVTASETATTKTVIDSDAVVGYLWYHWCTGSTIYSKESKTGSYVNFHAFYSTTMTPSNYNDYDSSDGSYKFTSSTACSNCVWYWYATVYAQKSTTYNNLFTYERWTDWSDWSETEVTATDTRKVETRTLYRYLDGELGDHSYEGAVTTAPTCTADGVRTYTCTACGDSYTEAIAAIGHSYEAVVTAPTCTEAGYTTHTCSSCGDSYTDSETAALGHTYESVTTDPTCTEAGSTVYTCGTCGDSYSEEIAAVGHSYESVVTAPTCMEAGYTTHTCSVCGDSYTDSETAALGHDYQNGTCVNCGEGCAHSYGSVTTDPTCTEAGATVYTCTVCGHSYSEEIAATGHSYEAVVNDPTCTEKGSTVYTCANCGDSYSEEIAATGHSYEAVVNDPTCTEKGSTVYTCSNCGDSYSEEIAATGHSYESVVTAPTCTEGGWTTHTCSVCGDSYTDSETAALGHNYVDGVCTNCGDGCAHSYSSVTTDPTCTEAGATVYTCAVCGHSYSEEIAATGHSYDSVVTAPTCAEAGYTTHTCSVCGDSYTDSETAALGHSYTSVTTAATCTKAGSTTYTCSVCGDSYSEKIAATGHSYKSVVTASTCTQKGYTTNTCTVCGYSYTNRVTAALGHNYESVVTEPTCDENGCTTYTCTKCGDSYTDNVITAPGHDYESVTVDPTCTEAGSVTYTCTVCGGSYSETVEALGHTYRTIVNRPTCTTTGYTTHICETCGDTFVDSETETLGHTYKSVVTAPTCTEAGYTTYTCAVCGDTYSADEVAALGHSYDNGCDADCNTCGETRTVSGHSYANGFCTVCDGYESAVLNSDGYYEIGNGGQLYWFAALVNGGTKTANAILTDDIVVNENVLSGGSSFRAWTPIREYLGVFDGDGNTVSGLYFNDSTVNYVGLFASTYISYDDLTAGTVRNVGVIDSYFCGGNYVAGLVARSYGDIENCFNAATVVGNSYVGGIAGYSDEAELSADITRCYNTGSVTGTDRVGGIAGCTSNCQINYCYNTGSVSAEQNVGGLVGYCCGYVLYSHSVGAVSGTTNAGGIVGYLSGVSSQQVLVSNCYYNSDVFTGSAIGASSNAGTANVLSRTTARFASGEVTYQLNGNQSSINWYQTVGSDAYPVLSGDTVYRCYACNGSIRYTNDASLKGAVAGHSYENGICTVCGEADPDQPAAPTIQPLGPSLSFKDEIYYNIYFGVDNPDDVEIVEMGVMTWTSAIDGTVETAEHVCPGTEPYYTTYFKARTQAISAKNMGEELYIKIYLKLADGTYIYSSLLNYSAKTYAANKLASSSDEDLKALCVALMNYGAAAQEYFGYKTDDLMNAGLTDEQKALVSAYSDDMIPALVSVGTKADGLAGNGGYSGMAPGVNFGGALGINYTFTPSLTMDGDMTLYVWTEADLEANDALTLDNASTVITMTENEDGAWFGRYSGISAKNAGDTVYACGVYYSDGVEYRTGVLPYSVAVYCQSFANNSESSFQPMAAASAVYTYYANAYLVK